jgi:D-alanyl-D-alanine dipeptidase
MLDRHTPLPGWGAIAAPACAMASTRPWSPIPIHDCGEALQPLPAVLWRLEPHPYQSLGAPYGPRACPFRVRAGLIPRLLRADAALRVAEEPCRLAIFDAWRPVAVQRFMVAHATAEECRLRGLDPARAERASLEEVRQAVARFWAEPSLDPATPPPHSTGGAVDLTLVQLDGRPLELGGAIDTIGPVSEPDHYALAHASDPASEQALWHRRRQLLAEVMAAEDFARHPNEWWHFSHGDQLWAWRSNQPIARYGRVITAETDRAGSEAGV